MEGFTESRNLPPLVDGYHFLLTQATMVNTLRRFLLFLAFTSPLALSAQTIQTLPFGAIRYCPGDTRHVTFSITGSFQPGNAFIAQLSDTGGRFDRKFQNIGSVVGTTPKEIIIPAPENLIPSYRYRI